MSAYACMGGQMVVMTVCLGGCGCKDGNGDGDGDGDGNLQCFNCSSKNNLFDYIHESVCDDDDERTQNKCDF